MHLLNVVLITLYMVGIHSIIVYIFILFYHNLYQRNLLMGIILITDNIVAGHIKTKLLFIIKLRSRTMNYYYSYNLQLSPCSTLNRDYD